MQLSAKALLKPFSTTIKTECNDNDDDDQTMPDLKALSIDNDDMEDEDGGDGGDDEDDDEEEEDPLEQLTEEERGSLLEQISAVCTSLNKVH